MFKDQNNDYHETHKHHIENFSAHLLKILITQYKKVGWKLLITLYYKFIHYTGNDRAQYPLIYVMLEHQVFSIV